MGKKTAINVKDPWAHLEEEGDKDVIDRFVSNMYTDQPRDQFGARVVGRISESAARDAGESYAYMRAQMRFWRAFAMMLSQELEKVKK